MCTSVVRIPTAPLTNCAPTVSSRISTPQMRVLTDSEIGHRQEQVHIFPLEGRPCTCEQVSHCHLDCPAGLRASQGLSGCCYAATVAQSKLEPTGRQVPHRRQDGRREKSPGKVAFVLVARKMRPNTRKWSLAFGIAGPFLQTVGSRVTEARLKRQRSPCSPGMAAKLGMVAIEDSRMSSFLFGNREVPNSPQLWYL